MWLSLDSLDDDPVLFLTGLITTLRQLEPALVLSIHTVKRHASHILAKMAVGNRTEAARRARELGIL